jgi:phage-related tail protein
LDDNIRRTVDEARREIPRNTQVINDYQEHTLQATREIADSYLESQKEIIQSFQSTWAPYIENMYDAFRNNWVSPQRAAEIYARTVSNCASNVMAATRVANNTIFANINAYKAFIQREKDDVKEFSRIAANTARTFENTSREFANNRPV